MVGENWTATKPWAPYYLKWIDGKPQLTANNADNLQPWANSKLTDIAHCRFENSSGVINLSGDTAVIRDCEIMVDPQLEGVVLHLKGKILLLRLHGLARPGAGKHQYWIQSGPGAYGNIAVRDCDLQSDSEHGLCLLHSPMSPVSSSIILENNRIHSAGCPEGAMVWIEKGTQPSIISITGMKETSGQPVKAVGWEQIPDTAALEEIKEQPKGGSSANMYKLQISDNGPHVVNDTPEIFAPLRLKPVSPATLRETFVPELSWNYQELESKALAIGKVLLASAFGVGQDRSTDDTVSIQKVFDAAGKQGNCLVIFPPGIFTISDTVRLPPNVTVRAAGVAAFVMEDSKKDMFFTAEANAIAFKNCDFDGGRNGVNSSSPTTQKARLAFDNCSFYDQQESGIQALAGEGRTGEKNQLELWVERGIFATMHAVTTSAAHSQLSSFWAVNDPRLNDDAFIRNLGGAMRIQVMLGVPTLWQGEGSRRVPENIKDWQLSKNTRWFDNWGKIYSLDNRFSGEDGGMCNVYNRSTTGTVYIGGGITRFYNSATRQCILYLEKTPRLALLRNIDSTPIKLFDGLSVKNADGSDGRRTPGVTVSGVPAP